jgi:hypothetical protein
MKTFFTSLLVLFQLMTGLNIFAQGFKIKIDGRKIKTNTETTVVFETNVQVDSIEKVNFQGLEIISGPSKNSSISIVNGKTENSYKLTYVVLSIQPGEIKLNAPGLYSKGKYYEGESTTIKFTGNELSEAELKEISQNRLRTQSIKPAGTRRIVFHEDIGYIEVYETNSWVFSRNLTSEEIKSLSLFK